MKNFKFYFVLTAVFLFTSISTVNAQTKNNKKLYSSMGLEIIFSLANVDTDFSNVNSDSSSYTNILRFAPVFNLQWILNYDVSNNLGFFTGADIRNLGLVRRTNNSDPEVKYKHRVYTFGVPAGIKLGNLDRTFVYMGYQIEWAWNYKQKEFVHDKKTKFSEWNSNRVDQWQQSVFIGLNFPYGTSIKFKYYLQNLLNQDYIEYDENGIASKPYAGQDSQIFYFSLNFFLFQPINTYKTYYVDGYETERAQRARLERSPLF